MARKIQSRLELRKQAEAAEAMEADEGEIELEIELDDDGDGDDDAPKKKKKAAKKKPAAPRAKRVKAKPIIRKKIVWVVYSNSMKEEGRFPYTEKEAAEARAKTLSEKANKKNYFILPVKEPITEVAAPAAAE